MKKATDHSKLNNHPVVECRKEVRRPYKCRQNIAFGTWESVPPSDAFLEVEFVDLSASGCSFRLDSMATANDLLIRLGKPPIAIYMQATVRHITPETVGGKLEFLIHCKFTGRLA